MKALLKIIIGLLLAAGIIALISITGCGDSSKLPAEQVPPRFKVEWQGSDLYLVTDAKTGKEYLKSYNGGFIEVK